MQGKQGGRFFKDESGVIMAMTTMILMIFIVAVGYSLTMRCGDECVKARQEAERNNKSTDPLIPTRPDRD